MPRDLIPIELTVNGVARDGRAEPRKLLVDFLREDLGLTGTHVGCETSLCGACTVSLNGDAVKSCTVLAVQADGGTVLTIESLASDHALHPLQEAFRDAHALQCGFCTPGMIMTAQQLLERTPAPTADEIRHALDGNFCRCTGYAGIIDAVQRAAARPAPRAAG